jgi:serine protease inhibitor
MKASHLVALILLAIISSVSAEIEKEDDAQFLICSSPSIDFQHDGYCSQTIFQLSGQESNKNFIFSPYGLDLALAVTSDGASGKTKEVLNSFCPSILNPQENVEMGVAIASGGIKCKPSFKELITNKYQAAVLSNNREDINLWVEEKTHGKIKNFLEGSLKEDSISLISTLYFKGEWYKPLESKIGDFSSILGQEKIDMLYTSGQYKQSSGDIKDLGIHWEGVDLPYKDKDISLTIILPTRGTEGHESCLNEFIASLNHNNLEEIINSIDFSNKGLITIGFPKMKLSTTSFLTPYFISLGINNPFSREAEFKNLSDIPFYISDIVQNCTVDINEQGTEASGATRVTLAPTSIALPQKTFTANKPFLFLIRSGKTIIFEGIFRGTK